MKFISNVDQDISRVSKASELVDILFNTRNKFYISAHPCLILFIVYIKIAYCPTKIEQ